MLQDQLQQFCRDHIRPDASITHFAAITDGWEAEVYAFDLDDEPLILRMFANAWGIARCEHEFAVIKQLYSMSYPVPKPYIQSSDLTILGKPFMIMQRIPGKSSNAVFQSSEPAQQQILLERVVRLYADLHQVDWRPFTQSPADFDDPLNFPTRFVEYWQQEIITLNRQTELQPVIDWMRAKIPTVPLTHPGLLHGDFHTNNILVTPDDQLYVIDWSSAMVGDTCYDLGWTVMFAKTYDSLALGELVLTLYQQHRPITNFAFYEVGASLRRIVDLLVSISAGADARGMRADAVEMMRKQKFHYLGACKIMQQTTGAPLAELAALIESF